ncbi:MAG: hypothetical protein IT560_05765 [Alphaproteobacteria bacterium]|nr:hypothetical protein [Alphaproteobacteria bacterium]
MPRDPLDVTDFRILPSVAPRNAGDATKVEVKNSTPATTYTYDALNRLLTVVYPAETALNATLSYDLSSGCGTPYKGHLCRVVDNTGTTNYQYDSLGRVTNVSETRGALTFTGIPEPRS